MREMPGSTEAHSEIIANSEIKISRTYAASAGGAEEDTSLKTRLLSVASRTRVLVATRRRAFLDRMVFYPQLLQHASASYDASAYVRASRHSTEVSLPCLLFRSCVCEGVFAASFALSSHCRASCATRSLLLVDRPFLDVQERSRCGRVWNRGECRPHPSSVRPLKSLKTSTTT